MREIKFRWAYKTINGISFKKYNLEDFTCVSMNFVNDLHHQCELIGRDECSGRNDKNGVEIYEGDILNLKIAYNCEYEYKDPSRVFNHSLKYVYIEVKFIDGCFVLASDKIPEDKQMLWFWDKLEVVGNIYENSELLKGSDE